MRLVAALVAAVALLTNQSCLNAAERPNIVVILADDLGYGSVGCYGADERLVQTPAIDRLAREGRRFTDANAPSSVCTPSRYALLTGRYCWRSRLNHGEVLHTFDPLLIETDRPTIASMLKKHGYRTGFVGKWHLGYGAERRVDYTSELKPGPLELGFDFQFAVPQNHNDATRVFVENHKVFGLRSRRLTPSAGNLGLDAPQRDDAKTMEQLTDRAVAWLEKQSPDTPFFLYFSPVAVHERITPSDEAQGTSKAGPYGDFIHDLDRSVDRILTVLDQSKLSDKTLVLFTSDNGGVVAKRSESGSQSIALDAGLAINGPWRGGKHDVWEGGFRVPFVVRWPGHVPVGTTCGQMINLVDFYATLAAVVGEPLHPDEAAPDSYNMLPAIVGEPHPTPIRPAMILQSASGVYAVRQGPWKWIEGRPSRKMADKHPRRDHFHAQLINLSDDPGETTDVSGQHSRVVTRLSRLLNEQRERSVRSERAEAGNAQVLRDSQNAAITNNRRELVLAYYYPWYIEGDWSRHAYVNTPVLGEYGTDNPQVVEQHIQWAQRAGLDGFVVSWWGPEHQADRHFKTGYLRAINARSVKFAFIYECQGRLDEADGERDVQIDFSHPAVFDILVRDFEYLRDEYFSHNAYLRIGNRPLVVLYLTRIFRNFDVSHVAKLEKQIGVDLYLIGDEPFFGRQQDPSTAVNGVSDGNSVFDAYTAYNVFVNDRVRDSESTLEYMRREALPLYRAWAEQTVFCPGILPSYHDFRGNKRLTGTPEEYQQIIRDMRSLPFKPVGDGVDRVYLITSFNEWWEGTTIEPATGYGTRYLDATRNAFDRNVALSRPERE